MERADLLGFVAIDTIQNIFIDEVRKIEDDIAINGMPLDRRIALEWVDNIRLRLMAKARDNVKDYLQQNPDVKKDIRDSRQAADQTEARRDWKDRIAKSRERAKLSEE